MALGDFRAVFFPYCLQKQDDGRYAVLNREYKPVGFFTKEWIKYEEYPVLVNLNGLTKTKVAKLSYSGKPNLDRIFLYDDATSPVRSKANMLAYLAKLEILAGLSVTDRKTSK